MTTVAASAPGKVLITGEYAVLGGASAISMAVNRRATARVQTSHSGSNELVAKGYRDGKWAFPSSAVSAWSDGKFPLFECLWRRSTLESETDWVVELDTTPFCDPASGEKYGLGSSAALSVAAAAVLVPDASDIAALVQEIHAEFQGGSGSGVDVATSLNGGIVRYRMGHEVARVSWPAGLKFRLLWSGRSTATRTKLNRLSARAGTIDPELIAAADAAAEVWTGGDANRVLESISSYVRCLRAFDLDHDLGIFDAGHWQRSEEAWADGRVIYKPCGAGGGDVGIALGTDDGALDAFTTRAVKAGFHLLDVARDPVGLSAGDVH